MLIVLSSSKCFSEIEKNKIKVINKFGIQSIDDLYETAQDLLDKHIYPAIANTNEDIKDEKYRKIFR